MMGCDYFTNMPLIGFLFSRGILPLIFLSLIIFTIIFTIRTLSRNNDHQPDSIASDRSDSLEILKVRYAKGEINSEEFNKMRQILL
jgi:putative membrane protein